MYETYTLIMLKTKNAYIIILSVEKLNITKVEHYERRKHGMNGEIVNVEHSSIMNVEHADIMNVQMLNSFYSYLDV